MDNKTFDDCVGMLEDHFGKKLKEPRFYWDELKQLPGDAFQSICKFHIRTHGPTPGNFPTIQALMEAWQQWLKAHPHRQEVIKWEFCQYCEENSPGLILVRILLEKPMYEKPELNYRNTVVRCGHCQNEQYRNPTWPRYRRKEIEGKGWETVTQIHTAREEKEMPVQRPSETRSPGMKHIGHSLPKGDRDQEDIPF